MKKIFFMCFLTTALILLQFRSFSAISQAEHDALMDLYNSTNGSGWYYNTNWGGPLGTENTWYGVITDAENTKVLQINLSWNNLQGTLPASLNNLINITSLNLSDNDLTGAIPDLSTLTNLIYLDFSYNWYLDPAPFPIGILNATNLQFLRLAYTNRNGSIPAGLANLTNLDLLDLSNNYFTGDIPDLSALTNLIYLDFSHNSNLNYGLIPNWILNETHLSYLGLAATNREGAIPDGLANLTNLYYLDLSYNSFWCDNLDGLANLTNLEYLDLSNNYFGGDISAGLANLTNLYYLDLSYNDFWLYNPDGLSNLTNLEYLDLSYNGFWDYISAGLANLTNLYYLDLSNNGFGGDISAGLANLTNLYYLDLSYNDFWFDNPDWLSNLTNLEYLDLSNNYFGGDNLNGLSNLTNLEYLDLSRNNFEGDNLDWLSNLTNLEYLDLSNNYFGGENLDWLANLTNLEYLDLSHNDFWCDNPDGLSNLTNLEYLDLNYNGFGGNIPAGLANLTNLRYLDLSYNNFTGNIPIGLANLTNLQELHLSRNYFTGEIPNLSALSNLRKFYINGNNFVGAVPSWVSNLINLYNGGGLDIRWNGFYTSDASLSAFLNQKQCCGANWRNTQTVAPTNVIAGGPTLNSITVSWTPITYTGDGGGYMVYYSTTSGGPYTLFNITANKSVSSMVVTGLSSGTKYYFVVKTRTDSNGYHQNTVESEYSTEVSATTQSLTLSPASLPNGVVGEAYSAMISATGGVAPYTFGVTSGTLPVGLSLSSAGVLSGTPTTAGTSDITITATDMNGCTGTRSYSITILPCPAITLSPASLPNGVVGAAYSATISATGGVSPYTFSVTSGTLPAGLSLSSAGVLSGTPTTAGTSDITITATDINGCTGNRGYSIKISSCPTITLLPASLPNGIAGGAYSVTIRATGGISPYTYQIYSGSLPPGLTLGGNGVLSGIPTTIGSYTFKISSTDKWGCVGISPQYTVNICPVITITPDALPSATVSYQYSQTLTAYDGTPPYTFTITSGSLPSGITLSPDGLLSGTPSSYGTFNIIVTATDANGCTGNRNYLFIVNVASVPPEIATGSSPTDALIFTSQTGITWSGDASATGYRLYRGNLNTLPDLLNGNVDSCTVFDGAATNVDDAENPSEMPGGLLWYLVTAYNASGEGSAGYATERQREVNSSGPCIN